MLFVRTVVLVVLLSPITILADIRKELQGVIVQQKQEDFPGQIWGDYAADCVKIFRNWQDKNNADRNKAAASYVSLFSKGDKQFCFKWFVASFPYSIPFSTIRYQDKERSPWRELIAKEIVALCLKDQFDLEVYYDLVLWGRRSFNMQNRMYSLSEIMRKAAYVEKSSREEWSSCMKRDFILIMFATGFWGQPDLGEVKDIDSNVFNKWADWFKLNYKYLRPKNGRWEIDLSAKKKKVALDPSENISTVKENKFCHKKEPYVGTLDLLGLVYDF